MMINLFVIHSVNVNKLKVLITNLILLDRLYSIKLIKYITPLNLLNVIIDTIRIS